jgi:hypothetical protein
VVAGCEDRERCEPETEIACECEDGANGTRYCLPNRSYDQCYCFSGEPWPDPSDEPPFVPFDAGRPDAGPAPKDAGLDADARPLGDGVQLASGPGVLLDVFAAGTDVWVVLPDQITRISLEDGSELARWEAPRPLSGATFDGTRLVALDGAKLTLLDKDGLGPGSSTNLIEPCKFATLVSDGLLVCTSGSSASFYVLDVTSDAGLSFTSSVPRGGPVMAVPGTQRFLIADSTSSSFSSLRAFSVDRDAGVAALNDGGTSPSNALFVPPLAFDAVPAENLVNRQGILLRMNGSCGTASEPCFVRTGTLGLLQAREGFLGLDSVGGELFGLADGNADNPGRARCTEQFCRLVRIDVPARELRAEQTFRRPLRAVIALRALPDREATVLGLGIPAPTSSFDPFGTDGGFEVVRVDWQTEQ